MGDFAWSRAQVEEVFASVHKIKSAKRAAFRARLRHLQRWGVPPGSNTGKGKAADYGGAQVTILGIALQLLELGVTPERSAILLTLHKRQFLERMAHAAGSIGEIEEGSEQGYTGYQQLILVDPAGLSDLTATPAAARIIDGTPANQVSDYLASPPSGYAGHLSIIDLRWLARSIASAAEQLGLVSDLGWEWRRDFEDTLRKAALV